MRETMMVEERHTQGRRPTAWWLTAVCGVWLVAGCSGGETPPPVETQAPPPQPGKTVAAAKPSPAVQAEAATATEPPYFYRPDNRRDPFRSVIVSSGQGELSELLHPLQRHSVNSLKLIAILWGEFGGRAMLQTPDGHGYTVQTGTAVGNRQGVIKQITPDRIIVEERYKDIFGERRIDTVELDLHPPEEGSK